MNRTTFNVEVAALRLADIARTRPPSSEIFPAAYWCEHTAARATLLLALAEEADGDGEPDMVLDLLDAVWDSDLFVDMDGTAIERTFEDWMVRIASQQIQRLTTDPDYAACARHATPKDCQSLIQAIEQRWSWRRDPESWETDDLEITCMNCGRSHTPLESCAEPKAPGNVQTISPTSPASVDDDDLPF